MTVSAKSHSNLAQLPPSAQLLTSGMERSAAVNKAAEQFAAAAELQCPVVDIILQEALISETTSRCCWRWKEDAPQGNKYIQCCQL